ncbi:hypothetical protein D3C75_473800 [compost metagenome]
MANTKLTLEALIAKKQQNATRKIKTKDIYVPSLDAEITIVEPSKQIIYQFCDRIEQADNQGTEEKFIAQCFLISQCVELFKAKDFYADESSPELATHKVLSITDIGMLVDEINKLSGSQENFADTLKN